MTRPVEQAGALADQLMALGLEVELCPLIAVEPLGDAPLELGGYDWLIVTSPNGAAEVARRRWGALPRVAAIGPGTAEALHRHGIEPALVPTVSTQDGLVAEFPRPPGRVLFAGAEGARRLVVEALGADFLPLYRTRALRPATPPRADVAAIASGSAARALAALTTTLPVVSIGPETTRAALAAGLTVLAEAGSHDLDGLAAAVAGIASG